MKTEPWRLLTILFQPLDLTAVFLSVFSLLRQCLCNLRHSRV
ncbi:hypothetical protein [Desulfobacca acetoxidans]|nr:hypothetical protein [Desulfobacca acetoxidans]